MNIRVVNKNVTSTNNLIEQYYKIRFRHNLKKIFRTEREATKRIKANEISCKENKLSVA